MREIAVLDEQGRSRFGLIQPRIHQTNPNEVAHLSRKTPVKMFAFDLLYWDGYDLRGVPLDGPQARADPRSSLPAIASRSRSTSRQRATRCWRPLVRWDWKASSPRSDQQIRAEAKPQLAQAEGHRPAGVRDLRLYAWRARHFQFAGARRLRRRQAAIRGLRRDGLRR